MSEIKTVLNPVDIYTYGRVDRTFPICEARGLFNIEYSKKHQKKSVIPSFATKFASVAQIFHRFPET